MTEFNIEIYVNEIKKMIPNEKNFETFFPTWKTDKLPEKYTESMYGIFAETAGSYYGCACVMCCIPKVRVLGSDEDWSKLEEHVNKLNELFDNDYTHKIKPYVEMICKNWNNGETWKNFYGVEDCMCGPSKVKGDIRKLIDSKYVYNSADNVRMMSKFSFTNNGISYAYLSGIIGGKMEDGFLVPIYNTAITKSPFAPK